MSKASYFAPLLRVVRVAASRARAKRAEFFRQAFHIDGRTKILDLGYGGQENIRRVLEGTDAKYRNVYIADIHDEVIREDAKRYGFVPVVVDESGPLPFPDGFFDIVYCSSVIEHVTVPKHEVWSISSGREFREQALERQRAFADEIRRVGRQYFVQCPYRHFPIESHSLMPFFGWLPRPLLLPALRLSNRFGIKKTNPDWHLLNKRQLMELFPGSRLIEEKALGLTKSIMAVWGSAAYCD